MSLVNDMLLDLDNRTQTQSPDHYSGNKEYRPHSNKRLFWPGCVIVLVLISGYMAYEYRRISYHVASDNVKATEITQPAIVDAPVYSTLLPVNTEADSNRMLIGVDEQSAEPQVMESPVVTRASVAPLADARIAEKPISELISEKAISEKTISDKTVSDKAVFDKTVSDTAVVDKSGAENPHLVDVQAADTIADGDSTISTAKIAQLLTDAERALNANQLTSPLSDNAFNRYQAVLLLDANNPNALQGIQALVMRYFEFYSAKVAEGQIKPAHFYLSKAKQVAAGYPTASAWLSNALQQFNGEEKITVTAQADAQPEVLKEKSNTIAKISISNEQTTGDTIAVKVAETTPVVLRNTVSPDKAKLAQAAFDESQILIKQGDLDGAIALLETHQPAKNTNANYFSLLAALYQKVGRYEESVGLYQTLLSQDDSNATYWLGLAISLDAIPKTSNALQAFRYARLYGAGDSETQHYITERIAQLTQ